MKKIIKGIFRFTQRHFILSFIALCMGGCVGANLYATHSGYCFKTGKYFSELNQQEMIDSYIPVDDHRRSAAYDGNGRYVDRLPYKNKAHFKALNPDCCKIFSYNTTDPQGKYFLEHEIPISYSDTLMGNQYRAITIHFLEFVPRRGIHEELILKTRPANPNLSAYGEIKFSQ